MAKKKRTFLGNIWGFAKYVWGIAKWIGVAVWNLARKGIRARQASELEKKGRGSGPEYLPFEEIETFEGELSDFESGLFQSKSAIGLILGSRGSGKSALGMRFLENVAAKTGRKICCMGFARNSLPKWIEPVASLEEVKNNSFLLVDEGGVEFSSRNSMSSANKLLSQLLLISRHKDINVLFISQNSSNIEVNAIRQSDYLLLKQPSLLQMDFERKAIRGIYEKVKAGFMKHRDEKGIFYAYSDQFQGFASNSLPSFWSESLSKSYKDRK